MADITTPAPPSAVTSAERERANRGWDAHEIAFRDRMWDDARWQLEARWPRGTRVRVIDGPLAGTDGTVTGNRVYAADTGAWVVLDNGAGGLVHWSNLERLAPTTA